MTIYEVGPRDGLQNESAIVPVEVKAEFIHRLVAAGLPIVEATSFVHPTWVPAARRRRGADRPARGDGRGRDCPVLVPNERGLDRALELGCGTSRSSAARPRRSRRRNLNRSLDGQFAMFEPAVRRARDAGSTSADTSRCASATRGRATSRQAGGAVGRRLFDLGATQLSPRRHDRRRHRRARRRAARRLRRGGIDADQLAVHFHDTYGQALANAMAALRAGITTFDASAGGLGGCPYAESATGNLATEDLVWLLDGLGIEPGST